MTPALIKHFVIICLCGFAAVVLGVFVSGQDYTLLALPVLASLFIATIVLPGYAFLIAFGLTCPFVLPLPFVWGFPMILTMLGLCVLKYVFRRALRSERLELNYNLPIALFFTWVLIRYCMNPVMPGLAVGMSEGVTGFRAFLNYGICAALFFALGLFRSEEQIAKLLRWVMWLSAVFVCALLPLVFTKSFMVGNVLSTFGVAVAYFDNGWLRLVALPDLGLALVTASLLPRLFPLKKSVRVTFFVLGAASVVLAGNRSSALMLFAVVLIAGFMRYRWAGLATALCALGLCFLALYYIGENFSNLDPGLYRISALVSPRAAALTGADATIEWRKVRWERAMEDVRQHPFIGVSYGGLENAFIFATFADYERETVDIDVASGSIHNGYLANARALGVPSLVLFISIFLTMIIRQIKQALKKRGTDRLKSDLHIYLWMNLVCVAIHIYIGIDLNNPQLWFFMGLCTLLQRLDAKAASAARRIVAAPTVPTAGHSLALA